MNGTTSRAGALPDRALAELYQLAGLGFLHPVPELYESLADGVFQRAWDERLRVLGRPAADLPPAGGDPADHEAQYIALFHFGQAGTPVCPIHEGHYGHAHAGRGELLARLMQFYRHIGLQSASEPGAREQPDHLACELEVLAFLAFRESTASGAAAALACRAAQADFLEHHLSRWIGDFAAQARQTGARLGCGAFLPALATAVAGLVHWHAQALQSGLR
ncbi:MAG: molecular chaperone TorD family protein [Gammaproteobacteria bacterium]|nr:molecular chaperone TorD family protein [Gammaproteobacteria bacterium]